jgi:hypothetical protein
MNVKELIQKLEQYDQEAMVVVRGYEGGVDTASSIGQVKIKLNANTEGWYGKHEVAYCDSDPFDCEAIYIN